MALNPKITDWRGRCVWLIGASSGIGQALAHALHEAGAYVVVSARNEAALRAFASSHAHCLAWPLDVTDPDAVAQAARMAQAHAPHGRLDMVVYCAAHYRAQRASQFDVADALRHQRVNVEGALHCLAAVLPILTLQGQGHVSLIGSVAGYRGLPHSLAYGPTKAALINMAESLYIDLSPLGVGVSVINPGFVKTPLTAGNEFAMPALLSPEQAAQAILRGWARGQFEIHFPWRFTLWLKLLKHLPHRWYFPAVKWITGG
jgi:NAD(P)-dependent dehydrogenase (short-subunit alcohol dehydrogenase family)